MKREETIEQCKKKAEAWVNSPEFDAQFEESTRKVQATVDKMNKTMKLDWEELTEPFDI